jgi:hypothetical protein
MLGRPAHLTATFRVVEAVETNCCRYYPSIVQKRSLTLNASMREDQEVQEHKGNREDRMSIIVYSEPLIN